MLLVNLANELLLHILQSCGSIADVLSLASTCHRIRSVLHSKSHRLPTLFLAADAQFGPLEDSIRLVTHNESQPVHLIRPAPNQSFALLQQLVEIGHVAEAWAILYPFLRWRGEQGADRRFLTSSERFRVRRACYRTWLYSTAYHHAGYPRTTRMVPVIVRSRAQLFRPWSTEELTELVDLQAIFRAVIKRTICPSNGTVIRRHKQRFPEDPFPIISITHPSRYISQHSLFHNHNLMMTNQSNLASHHRPFHSTPHLSHLLPFASNNDKYQRTHQELHGTSLEGWGDEITHYYVLEDMLKLDPAQLLYLYTSLVRITPRHGTSGDMFDHHFNPGLSSKGLVETFIMELEQSSLSSVEGGGGGGGLWFENNGETMSETIAHVLVERGEQVDLIRSLVDDGIEGIVKT